MRTSPLFATGMDAWAISMMVAISPKVTLLLIPVTARFNQRTLLLMVVMADAQGP